WWSTWLTWTPRPGSTRRATQATPSTPTTTTRPHRGWPTRPSRGLTPGRRSRSRQTTRSPSRRSPPSALRGRASRPAPAACDAVPTLPDQADSRGGQHRIDRYVVTHPRHPGHRCVVRPGQLVVVEGDDHRHLRPQHRQRPVVVAAALSEPVALGVHGQAGDQCDVNLGDGIRALAFLTATVG